MKLVFQLRNQQRKVLGVCSNVSSHRASTSIVSWISFRRFASYWAWLVHSIVFQVAMKRSVSCPPDGRVAIAVIRCKGRLWNHLGHWLPRSHSISSSCSSSSPRARFSTCSLDRRASSSASIRAISSHSASSSVVHRPYIRPCERLL